MDDIMVSVICLAYNQEKYIRETLDSFLAQKTDFAVEYLIHDDASTDGTAEIIREYEKKYPDIIKPVYETENQYSKDRNSLNYIMNPWVRGKYIAYCEGDDYWIDERKLQKQVDYMEAHPECTMCFTNGLRKIGENYGKRRVIPGSDSNVPYYKPGDNDYDFTEMLFLDLVPTASLLFPAGAFLERPKISPDIFGGDCYYRLYATSLGYAHCIDEDMCVYRLASSGSATLGWQTDPKKSAELNRRTINLYLFLDELTGGKYHDPLMKMKLLKEFQMYRVLIDRKNLKRKEFRSLAKTLGKKDRLCYYAIIYAPWAYRLYLKRKNKKKSKK